MKEQNKIDFTILAKISRLALKAKKIAEGVISGTHRSHFRGRSLEFLQHREYAFGDDLRFIDWKVYARKDHFFIKQYEEETNLRGYIFLDTSSSMEYSYNGMKKLTYGQELAAVLAYIMLNQGDMVGLVTFSDRIKSLLPARNNIAHFSLIIKTLVEDIPGGKTDVESVMNDFSKYIKRRMLLLFISDLLTEPEKTVNILKYYSARKHEIMVFHILSPNEIELDWDKGYIAKDMETGEEVIVEPEFIKEKYQQITKNFIQNYKTMFRSNLIDYNLFLINQPLEKNLSLFFAQHEKMIKT
jgi:uncharacterized protein (DUF58 family)